MAFVPPGIRTGQKAIMGATNGEFNGQIEATCYISDPKRLRFVATVAVKTGNAANPSVSIVPIDDLGRVKTFTNMDDLVSWLNGGLHGISAMAFTVSGLETIARPVPVPVDPKADAVKQEAKYIKLRDAQIIRETDVQSKVSAAIALGWDVSPVPALVANYNEIVAQKAAATAIKDYYVSRVAFYHAIAIK